jgi:hypothetical protein
MAFRASMPAACSRGRFRFPGACRRLRACAAIIALAATPGAVSLADSVYRWVDPEGVTHLTSTRPPAGIKAERIELGRSAAGRTKSSVNAMAGSTKASAPARPVSAEQLAQRAAVIGNLRTRECVYALESIDRLTSGTRPTDAAELSRLRQTVDSNCSSDPAQRREQEAMAAKLRVANGSICLDARNRLAAMLEPGGRPTREQLKVQQEFIEDHCKAPVR